METPAIASYDNVLVPLDGSEFAEKALPTASSLADAFEAQLHTLELQGDGVDQQGDEIGERASELGSTIVCLSSSPRGRVAGAFLDSLKHVIMRGSGRAVVAVGPLAERPGWDPAPRGWPKPLASSRIVVCVDGTDESERAIPKAVAWASALNKSLTILTVIEDLPQPLRPNPELVDHRSQEGADAYVSALVERWGSDELVVDGVVLSDPIGPASALRLHLAQRSAALVVLVTPDRTGMHRIRKGATAGSIIQNSSVPCLLVPGTAPSS